jgi:hypothetical protein
MMKEEDSSVGVPATAWYWTLLLPPPPLVVTTKTIVLRLI